MSFWTQWSGSTTLLSDLVMVFVLRLWSWIAAQECKTCKCIRLLLEVLERHSTNILAGSRKHYKCFSTTGNNFNRSFRGQGDSQAGLIQIQEKNSDMRLHTQTLEAGPNTWEIFMTLPQNSDSNPIRSNTRCQREVTFWCGHHRLHRRNKSQDISKKGVIENIASLSISNWAKSLQ